MPRNFKRKYKQLRLQATESVEIVRSLIGILSQHGHDLTFPTDVIKIVADLAAQQNGEVLPDQSAEPEPVHDDRAFRRLAEFADQDIQLDFVVVEESSSEENEEVSMIEEDSMPNSLEEMQRAFEAKNAAMMERLASNGVRSAPNNPANGKKMVLDPDAPKRLGIPAPTPAAATHRKSEIDKMIDDLALDNVSKPTLPSRQSPTGKKNPQTGLSAEEARAIIARTTGKTPKVPAGNPVMKPAGF